MNFKLFKNIKTVKKINQTLFKKLLVYFLSLFVLIVLFLGFSFIQISLSTLKKQITNYANDNLNQIIHTIERSLNEIDRSMINLAFDNTILTLIHNNMSYSYMYNEYQEVLRTLAAVNNTNSYLDSIYLYVQADEKVITSNKDIIELSEFKELEWVKEYNKVSSKLVHIRTQPIINVVSNINKKKVNVISIIRSLPILNRTDKSGVLVYNIDEERLNQVINRKKLRGNESVYIIDGYGKIISTQKKEELYKYYDWTKRIAEEQTTSFSGVEKINGVKSFVVYGTIEQYNWKVISITPYESIFSEQSRLQTVFIVVCIISIMVMIPLVVLVSRKLYSPILNLMGALPESELQMDSEAKSDILYINESIKRIISDKELLRESFISVVPAAREKFVRNLISGYYSDDKNIETNMKTLGIDFSKKCFSVLLIEIDNITDLIDINNEYQRNLILMEYKKHISDALKDWDYTTVIAETDEYRIAVIVNYNAEGDMEEVQDKIYSLCLDLKDNLNKLTGNTVTIGLGRPGTGLGSIKGGYNEALRSIKHKLVFGKNNVIQVSDIEKDFGNDTNVKSDRIHSILKNLRLGDMDVCVAEINSVIDTMAGNGTDILKIYKFLIGLVNSISFTLYDMGTSIEEIFGKGYDLADSFIKNEDIRDMKVWFSQIFSRIGSYLEEKRRNSSNETINKVKNYILENYSKEITLNDIAREVYLNPSYLGKLFKKVEGKTFNEFLNNVRMEKAKEYLLKTDMKIGEIAEAIGINNSRYFTYCFKSCYGVTPKAFRGNNTLNEYETDEDEED